MVVGHVAQVLGELFAKTTDYRADFGATLFRQQVHLNICEVILLGTAQNGRRCRQWQRGGCGWQTVSRTSIAARLV